VALPLDTTRDNGCRFPLRFPDTAATSTKYSVFRIGTAFTNQFLVVEILVWMIKHMGLDMEPVLVPNLLLGPLESTVRERAINTGSSHLASLAMAIPYVQPIGEPPIAVFALSAPLFSPIEYRHVRLPTVSHRHLVNSSFRAQKLVEWEEDRFLRLCARLHQTVRSMKGRGVDMNAKLELVENVLNDWYANYSATMDDHVIEGFMCVLEAFGSE